MSESCVDADRLSSSTCPQDRSVTFNGHGLRSATRTGWVAASPPRPWHSLASRILVNISNLFVIRIDNLIKLHPPASVSHPDLSPRCRKLGHCRDIISVAFIIFFMKTDSDTASTIFTCL